MGILAINAGVTSRSQGFIEVKYDNLARRKAAHEISNRRGSQDLRILLLVDLLRKPLDHRVDQVIALDSETLAAGHRLHARLLAVDIHAQLRRGGIREHHHLIVQVDGVAGLFPEAQLLQAIVDYLLGVALADIDDVNDLVRIAESGPSACRRARWSRVRRRWAESPRVCKENLCRARRTSTSGKRCPCRCM